MNDVLKDILPIYIICYFGLTFVLKSVIVAKRIGKNPLVFPKDDSAYGLIGLYFKLIIIAMIMYVFAFAYFPDCHNCFLAIIQLENSALKYSGLGLLLFALVWTIIAQVHMKNEWRIGIDTETKTELITSGLFGCSRNPIFFGMIVCLIGLFFCTANAVTALFLILGFILIQIQIRLEEEFLIKEHGEKYLNYKLKVRRFIGTNNTAVQIQISSPTKTDLKN